MQNPLKSLMIVLVFSALIIVAFFSTANYKEVTKALDEAIQELNKVSSTSVSTLK